MGVWGQRAFAAAVGRALRDRGVGLAVLFGVWHVGVGLAYTRVAADLTEPMAAQAASTVAMMALYAPLLGGVPYVAGAAVPPTLARAAATGVRRWFALVPAWLVYSNRIAVGLILGVVPGLVWVVQGRFLAQAVALRPDVPPFEHSRAVVAGAWWPLLALTGVSAGTQLLPLLWSDAALASLGRGEATGYAHAVGAALAAALVAGFWCVVDTVLFLHLERRNGLTPGGADGPAPTHGA